MVDVFYPFVNGHNCHLSVDVLGGKGLSLHKMKALGMPVPPGFVISTQAYEQYKVRPKAFMEELPPKLYDLLAGVSLNIGYDPLYSVRSGAPVSCPGMLDTILNVGLTTGNMAEWAARMGKKATLDCYRRLIQMMGSTAFGVPAELFEEVLSKARAKESVVDDKLISEAMLEEVIVAFAMIFKVHTGIDFPDTMSGQLHHAINAVFGSWMNPRAITYRKLNNIADSMGTAVVIQAMVFGNMNDNSGSGVLFSRDPTSGQAKLVGEFLPNAQGEDVVAGVRTPLDFSAMEVLWPKIYEQLDAICDDLEDAYLDMVDIEFTVQDGVLYMLQCRPGKRAAKAGVEIAWQMYIENRISFTEARNRLLKIDMEKVTLRQVDPAFTVTPRYIGIGATSGVVSGLCVLTSEEAEGDASVPTILVRLETDPDDIGGMAAAVGILTRTGGATSHAAVVARGMNKACVVGCTDLPEDLSVLAGHQITIDAATGRVWVDTDVPLIGGEANLTLQRLAFEASSLGLTRSAIPYNPKSNLFDVRGRFSLDHETLMGMDAPQLVKLADLLEETESQLILDFRQASCPDDRELEGLWSQSLPPELPLLSEVKTYLVPQVRDRVTVLGSTTVVDNAKQSGFSTMPVPTSLMEVLTSGCLEVPEAVEKKIGGKATAAQLKIVLEKAGFKNKTLASVAPWQYVFREWLEGPQEV